MDFKFSKDSDGSQGQEATGETKKQSALLVLLLILVGGFTYLYFFTPLIRPQEAQKTPHPPVSAPQVVKTPLPPRDGDAGKVEGILPEKTSAPKVATTPPVAVATPAIKTAGTAPATKPAPVAKSAPAAKPTPATKTVPVAAVLHPKAKEEPIKSVVAKPTEKKPQPAVAEKKAPAAQTGLKKAVSGGQAKPEAIEKVKNEEIVSWSLVVGEYVLEETLSADMGRVRKAGLEPIVKPAARKKTIMNRLLISEFPERAIAQATLDKLKRHTSDAFVIEQGGKFTVYAGSYLQSESAQSERERLKGAGFTATVKHIEIAIPSQSLSVGPFKTKKAADLALVKLKSAGVKATLAQK